MSFLKQMVLGTARKDFLLDARLSQEVLRKPSRFRFGWQEVHKMWKLNSYFMEKGVNNNFMRMEQLKLNHFQLHRAVNSEFSYRALYRLPLYVIATMVFNVLFMDKPVVDWQNYHDSKYDMKLYGDLEEGGDEGGDDD